MKFSACWIAKDEAAVLARSIESVRDAVDELVVVDTGSTDNTIEIALSYGARIEHFDWIGDFSAARNYALSQTTGDITIFLDADEWFVPSLTQKDGQSILEFFQDRPDIMAINLTLHNLNSQGIIFHSQTADRILRKNPEYQYLRPVHEQYLRLDGGALPKAHTDTWVLHHTGYVSELMQKKTQRNLPLMLLRESEAEDEMERALMRWYLVRENVFLGNSDTAFLYLNRLLDNREANVGLCRKFGVDFSAFFFLSMRLIRMDRKKISRMRIRRELVDMCTEVLHAYPGAPLMGLYYNILLDYRDDKLLTSIERAFERAQRYHDSTDKTYQEGAAELHVATAELYYRHGNINKALDHAVSALTTQVNSYPDSAVNVLLKCVRQQSPQDIVILLSSIFNLSNPDILTFLVQHTRTAGLREVHTYFLRKKLDTSAATKADFLDYLLAGGKYAECAQAAIDMSNDINKDMTMRYLYLSLLLSGDELFYHKNKERLQGCTNILDAYFSGEPLEGFLDNDLDILSSTYGTVALCGGIAFAERYLSVFKSCASPVCYQVKAEYCLYSGQPEPLLADDIFSSVSRSDVHCYALYLDASVQCNKFEQAFDCIRGLFSDGIATKRLLQFLYVVAARGPASISGDAMKLYEDYTRIVDETIDMQDVADTGYVYDLLSAEETAAQRTMTIEEFHDMKKTDCLGESTVQQLKSLLAAAPVYEEKGMPQMAIRCWRYVYSREAKEQECLENLSRVFAQIGNTTLSKELKRQADVLSLSNISISL